MTTRRLGLITLPALVVILALVLVAVPCSAATRALVFNATGQDLMVVVNGRGHIHHWETPAKIYESDDQLVLETPNLDGQLLTKALEPLQIYVIIYRQSTAKLDIWNIDRLETKLDEILEDNPGAYRAAVFNTTGQPLKFRFKNREKGIGRELPVFTPNSSKADELSFDFIKPELPSVGPLAQNSLHVVTYAADQGYAFMSLREWAAGLKVHLLGQRLQPLDTSGSGRIKEIAQEDLSNG